MVVRYIQNALRHAEYKKLDDQTWFVEIPGFEGVWANAATVEECRSELEEVLGEWLVLKIRDGDPLLVVDGLELKVRVPNPHGRADISSGLVNEIRKQAGIEQKA